MSRLPDMISQQPPLFWLSLGVFALTLVSLGCSRQKPLEQRGLPELTRMLSSTDPVVQAKGAYGLGEHGSEAAAAVPQLIEILSSPDLLVRQQACAALGKIGPPAATAVPALVQVVDDPEWIVRQQAIIAIGEIGPPPAQVEAALTKCATDRNARVQAKAKETLEKLRSSAPR